MPDALFPALTDQSFVLDISDEQADLIADLLPTETDFIKPMAMRSPGGIVTLYIWPMRLHVHGQECFRA